MLFGGLDHFLVLLLVGICGSRRNLTRKFLSSRHIEPCEIVIVVKTLLSFGNHSFAVAISYHNVHDHIALALLMIHDKDVVGKIKLIVGISQQVVFTGGEFLELVYEIVAKRPEQSAGDTERLACQLERECHSPQNIHLVGCFKAGLLIDKFLRLFDLARNRLGIELHGFTKIKA